ncbi:MAG: hypothetical protein Q9190_001475 [Brigantiaea leucoxantha]
MASPPFQVKAVFEYSSPHDDDLSFPNGQVLTVTEEEDADWYYGEYRTAEGVKKEGLFPRNFVKVHEPETPPRPSRLSRSKKELETPIATNDTSRTVPSETTGPPAQTALGHSAVDEKKDMEISSEEPQSSEKLPAKFQEATTPAPPSVPSNVTTTKPPPSLSAKPSSNPASDSSPKSVTGSFRDRINAFNKPVAPPVAPVKPSGLGSSSGTGFVKKPFVAPPPSKNAYIPPAREPPPQKIYRREEELAAEDSMRSKAEASAQVNAPPEATTSAGDEEDQPKPTSLKDRIALLQKQQMEQASRHAEVAQKKEKPKRPSKKRTGSSERPVDPEEGIESEPFEKFTGSESYRASETRPNFIIKLDDSAEVTPVASPSDLPRQFLSDANDADVSGAADTEDPDTSRGNAHERSRARGVAQQRRPVDAPTQDVGDEEDDADEEDPEEVDPEIRKRMEIRERMAKMSGGMGMAGMFGPPAGLPSMPAKRQAASASENKTSGNDRSGTGDSAMSRAPPVPMMPMPGLTKVQSPEQQDKDVAEGHEDKGDIQNLNVDGKSEVEVADTEEIEDDPPAFPRSSTDRAPPPPVPQG